jgi:SAM-dependent methyltransferase
MAEIFDREREGLCDNVERQAGFRLLRDAMGLTPVTRVMDYGSGLGFYGFEVLLTNPSAHVVFADISKPNLAIIRKIAAGKGHGRRVEVAWVSDPQARNLTFALPFDLIISMGVLHHTPHAKAIVKHVSGFLKPGGLFLSLLYNYKFREDLERAVDSRLSNAGFGARTDPLVGGTANPYSEPYDEGKARSLFDNYTLERVEHPIEWFDLYLFRKMSS